MFVRKKNNKSGLVSIQIIDKSSGKYKVLKTIGSSKEPLAIEKLAEQGQEWIDNYLGILEFDFDNIEATEQFIGNIEQITIAGTELLLGRIFDEIGFNKIEEKLFRVLVLSRIIYPVSKLKTTDLLAKYQDITLKVQNIYRYLDKLYTSQKEQIQQISYSHTLKVLNENISIVFYDVTTLYFEIDQEDEIRKRGFSKDGKHQNPQIILGLLVSLGGYPLAYEIFEGNKFEGHTMLPIIDRFKEKYNLEKLVIVADSGLLSNDNIQELKKKRYEFILGARIKNERQEIKTQILALEFSDKESKIIKKDDLRLIVSYSAKRAKKDKFNRERGLKRLKAQIKSGKLTKSNINNRGYNKYLIFDGNVKISLDEQKVEDDGKWDGLKGYLTNTELSKEEIMENYANLWKIEEAFRISKHDLKIRPIFHRLQKRIEAHITISFVAYKIYKELERQLKEKKASLSPEKAIDIAKTIYCVKVKVPTTDKTISKTLWLNDEQKYLAKLFNL